MSDRPGPKPTVFLASGTRGDVQPYLALARALRDQGRPVRIATHRAFKGWVERAGLPYAELADNPSDWLVAHPEALMPASPAQAVWSVRYWRHTTRLLAPLLDSALAACHGAGQVVGGLPTLWARDIAEAAHATLAWALLQPLTPTAAYPCCIGPALPGHSAALNRASYRLVDAATWLPWRAEINRWRRAHGLPARDMRGALADLQRDPAPVLYGFSAHVVPPPADWPAGAHVTGYWRARQGPLLPDAVRAFVAHGDAIYLGAGSALSMGPLFTRVLGALEALDLRAIVHTPDARLLPKHGGRMLAAQELDHAALFPLLRAVVHHGGAGTLSVALHAGVPSVVLPVCADQMFWGRRAQALGVAPGPQWQSVVTTADLITALAQTQSMRPRARELARALNAEDGPARATQLLLA